MSAGLYETELNLDKVIFILMQLANDYFMRKKKTLFQFKTLIYFGHHDDNHFARLILVSKCSVECLSIYQ